MEEQNNGRILSRSLEIVSLSLAVLHFTSDSTDISPAQNPDSTCPPYVPLLDFYMSRLISVGGSAGGVPLAVLPLGEHVGPGGECSVRGV